MTRLNEYIQEGRLIRQYWTGIDEQGRETACLLAAMSPEVAQSHDPGACPASLMPAWLAHLTPWIDDSGTEAHWPEVVRRYADLASRWHVLTPEAWQRAKWRCKRVAVVESMRHINDERALAACRGVLALLDSAISGDAVTPDEWAAAEHAAWSAVAYTAWHSAAREAAAARGAAVWAAEAAAREAEEAARAEASDRIIDAILDAIEEEIQGVGR